MNLPVDQLIEQLGAVLALYNRRSMDLPDGLFGRNAQFRLNGTSFEELLGRSPDDALVRMLTRGVAGYRFAAKALQHAVPDGRLTTGGFELNPDTWRVEGEVRLAGALRGTGEEFDETARIALHLAPSGSIDVVDAVLDPTVLARLRDARLRP
jgi:hypothetical protein